MRKHEAQRADTPRLRLDCPQQKRGYENSRQHKLGSAHVVEVPMKRMRNLHRVHKKKLGRGNDIVDIREDAPSVAVGKQRRRVALVTNESRGFYNPAHDISRAIRRSLDPEFVRKTAPKPVTVIKEAKADVEPGFKIPVKYVVEEREYAKCYMLPSGRTMWLPKRRVIDEGRYYVRVPWRYHFTIPALRIPPKAEKVLPREVVRQRLLARRGKASV